MKLRLLRKTTENVRLYDLKVQQWFEKGRCNEHAATINLKCNEIFTRGLQMKVEDFAQQWQLKHTSTVMEPSISVHTLVKLVDAEHIKIEKFRSLDLQQEIINVTSKLESQS